MKKILIASILSTLLVPTLSNAGENDKGYLTTKEGVVVKNNFGLCWNVSATKTPTEDCGDVIESKTDNIKPVKTTSENLPRRINEAYAIKTEGTAKVIVATRVLFKFDSHELSAKGKAAIDEQVIALKPYSVKVEGYTDSIGNARYNQILSEKRANSVKEYLLSKGIDEKIISVKGFGEKDLICKEKTKACNAENRRVEVKAEVDKK